MAGIGGGGGSMPKDLRETGGDGGAAAVYDVWGATE